MNVLYIDYNKFDVEEAAKLHKMVQNVVGEGNLITLPMDTQLLYDVDLKTLFVIKDMINKAIERQLKTGGSQHDKKSV